MSPEDEQMYRIGYADAIAGSAQQFLHHLAYLAGYRDGAADKAWRDPARDGLADKAEQS